MEYISKNNKNISKFGLGTATISDFNGKINIDYIENIFMSGFKNGINYFDTANSYGDMAEKFIGNLFSKNRHEIILSAKSFIPKVMPLNKHNLINSCEKSLINLKTDYIDYFFIEYDSEETELNIYIDTFQELKKKGYILNYGFINISNQRRQELLKLNSFFSMMIEFNALKRTILRSINLVYDKNKYDLIIGHNITARGLLSEKFNKNTLFDKNYIRNNDSLIKDIFFDTSFKIVEEFRKIGEQYLKTPTQIALKYVLNQKDIDILLIDPIKNNQLKENLNIFDFEINNRDLNHLEIFLDNIEENLYIKELEITRRKINKRIINVEEGTNDLIFVLENISDKQLYDDKILYNYFFELNNKNMNISQLENLRNELKQLIDI